MILKNIKSIRFNQGQEVKTLYFNSVKVWQKEDPVPVFEPEETVLFYTDGTYLRNNFSGTIDQAILQDVERAEKIIIGTTVTDVYWQTFANLPNLKEVWANDRPEDSVLQFYHEVFVNSPNLEHVSLPASSRFFCWQYYYDQKKKIFDNTPSVELTIRGKSKEEVECMDFYPFGLEEHQVFGTNEVQTRTFDELKEHIRSCIPGAQTVEIGKSIRPLTSSSYVEFGNYTNWYGWNIHAGFTINTDDNPTSLVGSMFYPGTDNGYKTFIPGLGTENQQMFCQVSQSDFVRPFYIPGGEYQYDIKTQINRSKLSPTVFGTKWMKWLDMKEVNNSWSDSFYGESTKWDNPEKPLYIWQMGDWGGRGSANTKMFYFKGGSYGSLFANLIPCKIDNQVQIFNLATNEVIPLSGTFEVETVETVDELMTEQIDLWNISQ